MRQRVGASSAGSAGQANSDDATPAVVPANAEKWPRDLAVFVGCGVLGLGLVITFLAYVLSDLSEDQMQRVQFPTDLRKAQQLGEVLSQYTQEHYGAVLLGHASVYIYLQTFAIPGTVFANLLGGALFGMYIGFPLCLLYNTVGSIFLYWFSQVLGKRLVARFFASRMVEFRKLIEANRSHLTVYMIFARVFPFTPNWFMNVASPQLHVPLPQFAVGVAIGLIPYNFLSCQAGLLLASLKSRSEIITPRTTALLAAVAVMGLVAPTVMKKLAGSTAAKPKTR